MEDYKRMYYALFNKLTDIIYELQIIQRSTEDMCPGMDTATQATGEERGEDVSPGGTPA